VLNIVIPMAGRGSRFAQAGFNLPKPLIPVHDVPMIRLVIQNLRPALPHRFIFLCLREHIERYNVGRQLRFWAPGCEVIPVDRVSDSAAATALLARQFIDSAHPLMIAKSDQWIDVCIEDYLKVMDISRADGLIMTMRSNRPNASYVRFDGKGRAIEVVERQAVSQEATARIYNFRRGSDFVAAADAMTAKNLRTNNNFGVASVYNELIAAGLSIACCNVGHDGDGRYALGNPSDLIRFQQLNISRRAACVSLSLAA
jgi:dTDP-glucose pyrophosphorylase